MTDAEILERLRAYFQNQINNLNATEMAEGPFEDGTEDGELWEQAASRIDARAGLRIRFEFGDESTADRIANLVVVLEKGAQMLVDRVGQVDEVLARLRDEQATRLPLADAARQREKRAVAEARPHDDEPVPVPCPRCEGCGQLANTDDREPWTAWENLPPGSDLAVKAGLVKPIPCDQCDGKKTVLRPGGNRG